MSRFQEIALPKIGDYRNVPVVEVMVKAGDVIEADDTVIALENGALRMEVPSPVGGRVRSVRVAVGDTVSMGAPILEIEATGPASAASTSHATAPHASPSVRAYAKELGVDIGLVTATGPNGRILRCDVQSFVKTRLSQVAAVLSTPFASLFADLLPWPRIDHSAFGEIERQPLTRIQNVAATTLARNYLAIPHGVNFDTADVTDLEEFRAGLNVGKRLPSAKVTMLAFLIKASALALKTYPRFNASLEGKDLLLKKYVNIGFAVLSEQGLLIPVVKGCDRKGVVEIAQEASELADKARQGTLAATDMQGGCFTVSSLDGLGPGGLGLDALALDARGGLGGAGFVPIVNAPEVAILGAARSVTQAVWRANAFEPRLIVPLSLSWDHRVVDGFTAARFLGRIASLLSDFRRSIL